MPIRRKPTGKEKDLEAFIQGGIQEPSEVVSSEEVEEVKALKLRIPIDLLNSVDALVKQRKPSPSRHQWILEAIYEKVEREQ